MKRRWAMIDVIMLDLWKKATDSRIRRIAYNRMTKHGRRLADQWQQTCNQK